MGITNSFDVRDRQPIEIFLPLERSSPQQSVNKFSEKQDCLNFAMPWRRSTLIFRTYLLSKWIQSVSLSILSSMEYQINKGKLYSSLLLRKSIYLRYSFFKLTVGRRNERIFFLFDSFEAIYPILTIKWLGEFAEFSNFQLSSSS